MNFFKGFTLIEILVTIALIAILATIGIPFFNGFQTSSKINSSQINHQNMVKYVSSKFSWCSLGGDITIRGEPQINIPGGSWSEYYVNCFGQSAASWAAWIGYHLRDTYGAKNVYIADEPMYKQAGSSPLDCKADDYVRLKLGESLFGTGGANILCLVTNVGDPDGRNYFLKDYIILPDYL
jgi:prepilin-type N-terminal cleavage/methylation domain-containing protein